MNTKMSADIEKIQRLAARTVATNPAGQGLRLIGGFRYRFIDRSCRTSMDLDYHWDGDLEAKQREIALLLQRKLLPEVQRLLGLVGSVRLATGPDADSPFVKIVEMAFHRPAGRTGRIEISVEITRISCLDKPEVRTAEGLVYLTASDADMIEGKILALFNRTFVQARDVVDVFLFQDKLLADSRRRLETKFTDVSLTPETVGDCLARIVVNRDAHVRAIDGIIADQIDDAVAANLKTAGGGAMIFDSVIVLLKDKLGLHAEAKS